MLLLNRKPGEKIHIGSGITITVVQVQGNRVRIGIDAPAGMPLVRAELNGLLGWSDIEAPLPGAPCAVRSSATPGLASSHE